MEMERPAINLVAKHHADIATVASVTNCTAERAAQYLNESDGNPLRASDRFLDETKRLALRRKKG